jgi:hypothetical protein
VLIRSLADARDGVRWRTDPAEVPTLSPNVTPLTAGQRTLFSGSLPPGWNMVRVRCAYGNTDGTIPSGSVTFTSTQTVISADRVWFPKVQSAPLDQNGEISIFLPATIDPDITPGVTGGWTYQVKENIAGGGRPPFNIAINATMAEIDLAVNGPFLVPAAVANTLVLKGDKGDPGIVVIAHNEVLPPPDTAPGTVIARLPQ